MNPVHSDAVIEREDQRYTLRYAGSELNRLEFILLRDKPLDTEQVASILGLKAEVFDFNYLGFSVRLPIETPKKDIPEIDERVRLIFQVQGKKASTLNIHCLIAHRNLEAEGFIQLGLKRIFSRANPLGLIEMRQSPRVQVPSSLGLTAMASHPLLYGHQTRLRLVDINLGMGYCLETHDPLFLGAEGGTLPLFFSIPGFSGFQVMTRVTWIQPIHNHRLRMGIQTLDMPFELYHAICRLLLSSYVLNPGVLREAGFYIRHVKQDIRFRQANRLEDYAQVLALRHESHIHTYSGKMPISKEEMALESDAHSRILTAWHGDRLIGCLTLYFPQTLHAVSDLSECVHQGDDSFPLPLLTESIEMRQLSVTDDFRGTDVLHGLLEQSMKAFLLSDRNWFLLAVQKEQTDFYVQMGFKNRGISRPLSQIHGHAIHILSMNREDFLLGRGISLWTWNLNYGDLLRYVLSRQLISVSPVIRIRMWMKLTFGFWSRFAYSQRLRKAYQAHLLELLYPKPSDESKEPPQKDWSAVP